MATSAPRKGTRSGNPAKKAAAAKAATGTVATSKAEWKGIVAPEGEALLLPSGNTALVARPGPEALMKQGFLPDTLGAIVQDAIASKKGLKKKAVEEIAASPQKILEAMEAIDRVCASVVIQPKLVWHKRFVLDEDEIETEEVEVIPGEERDPATFYTDEVDVADRMHIFQFALGGTRQWERFRDEAASGVGLVDPVEDAAGSPE